ncbi:MAG: FAD binding domain-containing protein [Lachnospiraceae bacterium]|nr:FAD binding domain-containing protein [Lachnospiraceae bacterium]
MYTMRNYVQAQSLEEAYELRRKNKNNVILGGNLWLKMTTRDLATGIDLCNLGLDKIEEDEEGYSIGCMCSLRDLETNASLEAEFGGAVKEALRHIVGVQFRNTATVGGSVFPRFGFSDVLTLLAALDCEVELYKKGRVSIKEFIQESPDQDILVKVHIKKDKRKVVYETIRMTETDFGILNCAVALKDDTYTICLGAAPRRAKIVEVRSCHNWDKQEEKEAWLENIVDQFVFGSNMRGTKEYRRAMAKVLITRAIEKMS